MIHSHAGRVPWRLNHTLVATQWTDLTKFSNPPIAPTQGLIFSEISIMQGNDAIALIIGGLTAFGLACWGYSVWYLRYLKRCPAQVRAEQERQARIRRANRVPGASVPTAPRSPPPRRASVPTAPRNPPPHKVRFTSSTKPSSSQISRPRTSPDSTDTSGLTQTSLASWTMCMV